MMRIEAVFKKEGDDLLDMSELAYVPFGENEPSNSVVTRKCIRLQRRCSILEEILNIYRKGLFELSSHSKVHSRDGDWIERDIELIRRSYVEELRAFEAEIESLCQQLVQSESYRSEIRIRLDDALRALYRYDFC